MDVVELGLENPVFLAIINEKLTIRRDLSRLYGTQICSYDARRWMLVGKLD